MSDAAVVGSGPDAEILAKLEAAARLARAIAAIGTVLVGFIGWLLLTAARYYGLPEAHAQLQEDFAVHVVSYEDHVRRAAQEDRAQTCMLRQITLGRDPGGCEFFLEDPSFYDPPLRR